MVNKSGSRLQKALAGYWLLKKLKVLFYKL